MRDELAIKKLAGFVREHPSQFSAAEALSISPQYLCDLLKERRAIPDYMADDLARLDGYERVIKYVRRKP
jgi:plasmid maintenance system antidote protein VapI